MDAEFINYLPRKKKKKTGKFKIASITVRGNEDSPPKDTYLQKESRPKGISAWIQKLTYKTATII